MTSSDPELVSGKRYLVYLAKLTPAFEADTKDRYSVLEYFEISENNTVDTRDRSAEDAAKINSIYSAEK